VSDIRRIVFIDPVNDYKQFRVADQFPLFRSNEYSHGELRAVCIQYTLLQNDVMVRYNASGQTGLKLRYTTQISSRRGPRKW